MKNKNISKKTQADLSRAYMGVYSAFVNAYQSRGFARAQSQFNAICVMRKIMMAYKNTKADPAINFLIDLYNTHYKIVAKKTMISPNKDKIEPILVDADTTVVDAINNFASVIAKTKPDVLCVLKKVPDVLQKFAQKSSTMILKQSFSSWLDDTASETDIVKLQNDPQHLGKLYNRYVMRQSHR